MPRRPRVEKVGFHHVVNRGVARGNIFLEDEDYEKFLEIVKIAKERYDFKVHSLCLMSNHYHLLIETKHNNLSLLIRQINAPYAQYFNRKYSRVGPLWQGRFKNWFVYDDRYLSVLFRYIEQNPIKAKITKNIGEYTWASSSLVLGDKYRELFKDSLLLEEKIWSMMEKPLDKSDYLYMEVFQKIVYQKREDEIIRLKQKSLDDYLKSYETLEARNKKILEAMVDGYKQSEIACYLGLSSAGVSYIVKKMKIKKIVYDNEELELLDEIEKGEWIDRPLTKEEHENYAQSAKYTKALQKKKQTTIRFSVQDLAIVKAQAKELGIGYENLIQALVHNYAIGKIKLGI